MSNKTIVVAVGKITPTERSLTVLHGGLKEDPPAPKSNQPPQKPPEKKG